MDCIVTGDREKAAEILQEKQKLDIQFQTILKTPVPSLDDIRLQLKRGESTSPIDPRITTPTSAVFKEAIEPIQKVLDWTPNTLTDAIQKLNTEKGTHFTNLDEIKAYLVEELKQYSEEDYTRSSLGTLVSEAYFYGMKDVSFFRDIVNATQEESLMRMNTSNGMKLKSIEETKVYVEKLREKFNEANGTSYQTLEEIKNASTQQINHYLIQDAKIANIYPKTNEERNALIKHSLRKKTDSLLSGLPNDNKEFKQRTGDYLKTIELYTQRLLDPNNKEIKIPHPEGGEPLVLNVTKTFGNKVRQSLLKYTDGDETLDMKFDITDISQTVHEELTALDSPLLTTKFFPITDKSGEKAISSDYVVVIDGKTGHLTENIEGIAEANIPQEVKDLITKHGRDNLVYLLDES